MINKEIERMRAEGKKYAGLKVKPGLIQVFLESSIKRGGQRKK